MKIEFTEKEYRTLLRSLAAAAIRYDTPQERAERAAFLNLRDNLRVRWERARNEEAEQCPTKK